MAEDITGQSTEIEKDYLSQKINAINKHLKLIKEEFSPS